MGSLLLAVLLLGAEGDVLVAELDRDFQALVADEPQAQQIRAAAALLEKHDQGGWPSCEPCGPRRPCRCC